MVPSSAPRRNLLFSFCYFAFFLSQTGKGVGGGGSDRVSKVAISLARLPSPPREGSPLRRYSETKGEKQHGQSSHKMWGAQSPSPLLSNVINTDHHCPPMTRRTLNRRVKASEARGEAREVRTTLMDLAGEGEKKKGVKKKGKKKKREVGFQQSGERSRSNSLHLHGRTNPMENVVWS
ncbi:hypothetical protein IE53DRAFT_185630 [Violaceomyces palustris]|uniref:Uncharacterized protein n=1 Tax=Violaceomyces palustris TaxID=1673888 RepID=A0ACD0NS16_9BASI|nr:hypothetical protein IE53DRAFT_185630 [Violaceomyces palustris]